jgi:photosystem II stability/assembly factor-like uncharacterized protein
VVRRLCHGSLHYTNNGGDSWAEITLPTGGGTINRVNDMSFVNSHFGFVVGKITISATVYGALWRTIDGGNDWELYLTTALTTARWGRRLCRRATRTGRYWRWDIASSTGTIYTASAATP